MKKYVLLLCSLLLLTLPALAQEPPGVQDTIVVITSPVPFQTISGQVVISGSAGHPSAFVGYELEYDNLTDPTEIWLPIGSRVTQQVTEGTLGIWDTVGLGISDGLYQIRLRVFLNLPDIAPVELIVSNLTLINTAPTPLPTIDTSDTFTPPTPGPSPTSPIEQPPTNTPRPTIESRIQTDNNSRSATSTNSTTLNFGRLQGAFCFGSTLAFGFFALLLGYLWLRARLRPVTRQLMWQIRSELDQERRR